MSLKIVIIGAGLGGLAAGVSIKTEAPQHRVLIVESAPVLTEVGAGLQLTPNATRLFERWGIRSRLENLASNPREFSVHRYSDGKLLGKRDNYGDEMLRKYGSNFWDAHRADLQLALYERCKELGVEFRFGSLVTEHEFKVPSIKLSNGERISGDVLVAADGLWSGTRASFLGRPSPATPTGDLAYRIVLKTADVTDDELRAFVSKPRVCCWVGPGCHAMYYPLKANTMCNIVLLVPDNLPENVARLPGDLEEMHAVFEGWDPLLRKFLSMVTKVDKWKLMHLDELESWYNDEATVVFLGDACHPMLPYMAQGAGSSLEDGAALGLMLSKATSRQDLPRLFKLYQALRKPRSTALQQGSMRQRHINHLPDGPEQEARDRLCQEQIQEPQPGYPFYWIDPEMQSFVYGYDVVREVERALDNQAMPNTDQSKLTTQGPLKGIL